MAAKFEIIFLYRSSADISRPYGVFVNKITQKPLNFTEVKVNSSLLKQTNNGVITKIKDIAWIVSHCETPSHREAYVQGLTISRFFLTRI